MNPNPEYFPMRRTSCSSWVTGGSLLVGLLLSGCGSSTEPNGNDDGTGGYFLRFRANGTLIEFKVQASLIASSGSTGTQHSMIITGYDPDSGFSISLWDNAAITSKTYTGYPNLVSGGVNGALFTYEDKNGVVYGGGSGTIDHSTTLTQITSSTVRGTFQGTLKAAGRADITVTNGEFLVGRIS